MCARLWAFLESDYSHVGFQMVLDEIDGFVESVGVATRRGALLCCLRKFVVRSRDMSEAAYVKGLGKRARVLPPVLPSAPRLPLWTPPLLARDAADENVDI